MALTSVSDNLIGATLNPLWRSMNFPFPEKWEVHCEHPVSKSALKPSSSQADQYCGYLLVPSFRQIKHQQSLLIKTWTCTDKNVNMSGMHTKPLYGFKPNSFVWLAEHSRLHLIGLICKHYHIRFASSRSLKGDRSQRWTKEISYSLHTLSVRGFHSKVR